MTPEAKAAQGAEEGAAWGWAYEFPCPHCGHRLGSHDDGWVGDGYGTPWCGEPDCTCSTNETTALKVIAYRALEMR